MNVRGGHAHILRVAVSKTAFFHDPSPTQSLLFHHLDTALLIIFCLSSPTGCKYKDRLDQMHMPCRVKAREPTQAPSPKKCIQLTKLLITQRSKPDGVVGRVVLIKTILRDRKLGPLLCQLCKNGVFVAVHAIGFLVDRLLLDNRVKDTFFEDRLDKVEDVEEVIPMRSPLRELVLEGELAVVVDQRVPHVAQKVHCWTTVGVIGRDGQLELEHCVTVVALVHEQSTKPHCYSPRYDPVTCIF